MRWKTQEKDGDAATTMEGEHFIHRILQFITLAIATLYPPVDLCSVKLYLQYSLQKNDNEKYDTIYNITNCLLFLQLQKKR